MKLLMIIISCVLMVGCVEDYDKANSDKANSEIADMCERVNGKMSIQITVSSVSRSVSMSCYDIIARDVPQGSIK